MPTQILQKPKKQKEENYKIQTFRFLKNKDDRQPREVLSRRLIPLTKHRKYKKPTYDNKQTKKHHIAWKPRRNSYGQTRKDENQAITTALQITTATLPPPIPALSTNPTRHPACLLPSLLLPLARAQQQRRYWFRCHRIDNPTSPSRTPPTHPLNDPFRPLHQVPRLERDVLSMVK